MAVVGNEQSAVEGNLCGVLLFGVGSALMKPDAFAALIAGLETDAQMSRTAIAEATGLSRSTIWRIAVGEARRPSHEAVEKVTALHQRAVSHMKQKIG